MTRSVTLLALLFSTLLSAQEFRGTISGAVTDPTGAALPGAKVVATETQTGTKVPSVTESSGQYTLPFLLPGDYDIAVQAQGFKSSVRKGVHLGASDHATIDFKLDVGEVTSTVEVTADASLLNTENASLGQSVSTKEVADLPINGRTPMMAAALSVGVIGYQQPTLTHPFDAGAASAWSVGGAYHQTSELLLNGSPNATWDGRLAYSPPQDAVQEVRIKVSDYDASFGHTAGGTLNQVTKSGTNAFHGSLWEFNQPNTLTANDFFLNQATKPRPVTHLNQYGLTAGGPIYVPHVVDTRNKLFWFFAWESMKDAQPNPFTTTVPTAAERKGDLSIFQTADNVTIYDPYSASVSGTTITRKPFPVNNQIPQVAPYTNSVAQALLKYFPDPNATPTKADGVNNYTVAPNTPDDFFNYMTRVDYNMNDKSRMFFDIRHTDYNQTKNNYFDNASTGSILLRKNWGSSFDEVYTFSPTKILDLRLNFTRLNEYHDLPGAGFDPTTVGFPSYMNTASHYLQFPVMSFITGSYQKLGNTGTGADRLPSQSYQAFPTFVIIKGNHSVKFGGDFRQYRLNTFTAGNSTGTFSFSSNSWVKASSSASSTALMGQDLAEFLMGLPTSGSYDLNTYGSWYSYYSAVFLQDDWRVKRNLTVNVGVHFDHDGPYHEVYGRTVNGFDNTTPSPLAAAAQTAYAKNPIAQLPANAFNVLGGLTFPGSGGQVYKNNSHLVSPRVGFAWTPEFLDHKTVFRGGFGMFVTPVVISTMDIQGKYSTSPNTNQEGFSQTTNMVVTNDNFATPATTMANPFPNGFAAAVGSSLGLGTFAGQNITFMNPAAKSPYSLRWNFGIQRSLGENMMLEVVYIGNHSIHLPIDQTQLNGIPRSLLSTLPIRDANQTYLGNNTPNPFLGLASAITTSTSISTAQVLARYPEFPVGDSSTGWNGGSGIIEQNLNAGSSFFHSINVHVERRYSHGLTLIGNYIYSKLTERVTWLNDSDPAPEKRVSAIDHPQRFVIASTYELPIGRGKALDFHSRAANSIIGGWQINTSYTFQLGAPINWNNGSSNSPGDYVYFGGPITLNNRMADPGSTAFNTGAFMTVLDSKNPAYASVYPFQYHIRTFPSMISALRQDGINQWDTSLLKKFHLSERAFVQLRFEFFNVINHPVFPSPNTTASSTAFGSITGAQANRPRSVQIAARIVF